LRVFVRHCDCAKVIGRGGRAMHAVEARSRARMQVQREDEMDPETKERHVDITGTAKERNRALKLMLDLTKYCRDEDGKLLKDTRPPIDDKGQPEPPYVLEIPAEEVGRVLGRNGVTVKNIEKSSDVKVEVDKNTGRLEIHGRREAQEHGVELILAEVTYAKVEDGAVLKDQPHARPGTDATPQAPVLTIWVKDREAGRVIGRNGETVQEIMKKSVADIKVQKSDDMKKDSEFRQIRIFGSKEQQELALDLVLSEVSWAQGEDGVLKAPPTRPNERQRRHERKRKKQLEEGEGEKCAEEETALALAEVADATGGVDAPSTGPANSFRRGAAPGRRVGAGFVKSLQAGPASGLWVCGTCGGDHRTKECPNAQAFLGMGMQIGMQMGMQVMGIQNLHMGMPMGGGLGHSILPMMGMPGMPNTFLRGPRQPGGGGRRVCSSSESSCRSSGRAGRRASPRLGGHPESERGRSQSSAASSEIPLAASTARGDTAAEAKGSRRRGGSTNGESG